MNVMNGLMHGAFWKSHDGGVAEIECLQVDQLTNAFREQSQDFRF